MRGWESKVEFGEYKGKPTITLNAGGKYPFSFGLGKALLILKHIKDIEHFANEKLVISEKEEVPF